MNRSLSIRQKNSGPTGTSRHRSAFSFATLRGSVQPELSRRLFHLIKTENNLINAHELASKERMSMAMQLSEWGEQTGDDAISDISDKIGVVLSELGEQEDLFAHHLDDSRALLKMIRNTEKNVQPARDAKNKVLDEIQKLKIKDAENPRIPVLEQRLVRVEAENLVADAQLANISRQKLREAYATEFAAIIERAEKQVILAKHGRRLLQLLDDEPIVPGVTRAPYQHGAQARQILNDAEDDLRDWRPEQDEYGEGTGEYTLSHEEGVGTDVSEPRDEHAPHHQLHHNRQTQPRSDGNDFGHGYGQGSGDEAIAFSDNQELQSAVSQKKSPVTAVGSQQNPTSPMSSRKSTGKMERMTSNASSKEVASDRVA